MSMSIIRSLIIVSTILISELVNECFCWNSPPLLKQNNKSDNNFCHHHRRQFLQSLLLPSGLCIISTKPSSARNLPSSTGADTSKSGTVESLADIVSLRYNLSLVETNYLRKKINYLDGTAIPTDEKIFKRVFDSYSNPVSYKQKFMDQNAFLVYYTKGFDGPGRPNIEEDNNQKQTLQFGARNEAWVGWDNVLTELKFINGGDDDADLKNYLSATIRAVDSYLLLVPVGDVKAAQQTLGISW